MARRVGVSLDNDQIKVIRTLKGFGKKDAEIVKNILLAYLSESGYISKFNKVNAKRGETDSE